MPWRVLTYRLAGEPSRHRVAVWRELRRVGAVALQSATWAIPAGDRFDEGLARVTALVERSGGQALCFGVLDSDDTVATLESLYSAEREAEWADLRAACDEVRADLRSQIDQERFGLGELHQAEQLLDRLRRRQSELRTKDLFGTPSAAECERLLDEAVALLDELADHVHAAQRRS